MIDVPEENTSAGLPVAIQANPVPAETKPQVTAAQAKVEAIADLTHAAYAKAATLRLSEEETASLQSDFPDEAFKPGAAGKENLIYIEHAFLRERFIKVFGMGGWALVPRSRWAEPFKTQKGVEGQRVYVEAMLMVRGCFVAEAVGEMEYYPSNAAQNYGDAVEGAKTAAFRRCAKEFGVGLQAWKKDWCRGWWDRKMAPGRRVHPTTPLPGHEHGTVRPLSSPAKAPEASRPTQTPPKELKHATDETRKWFIERVKESREQATQFCIDLTWLMPNETLENLPLRLVPNTKPKLVEFMAKMLAWSASGKVIPPYEADWEAEGPQKKVESRQDEQWYDVIVPIPRKGMRRDEYLKHPDTIGSLYEARHDDEDSRRRLWGFCKGGEECGWVPKPRESGGKIYQPSDADKKFYASLKEFNDWFDANHPEEKL